MKPMNFPGRKRQRQEGALARLIHDEEQERGRFAIRGAFSSIYNAGYQEIQVLEDAVDAGSQHHVHSKKNRTARGKLRPIA